MFTSILSLYKAIFVPTFNKNAHFIVYQSLTKSSFKLEKEPIRDYMVLARYIASLIRFHEI